MSDFEEQMKRLSPEQQKFTRTVVEGSKDLYHRAEAQLLDGFSHTDGRPRDGFDALVLVCAVAQMIEALAVGVIELGPMSEQESALLLSMIFTIGGAMGHGLIDVSPDFPFSAEEMVTATAVHLKAGTKAFSHAVADALKRNVPIVSGMSAHVASTYPEEHAAFVRLTMGDVGPIH